MNAGIQAFMPNGQKDVFKYMFDTFKDNALTFLGYGDSPWLQASYMAQILDFSDIVRQKGLAEALNIYGAGFFNAVAVNEIVKTNYTLGGYFEHMLKTGQYRTETVNGREVIAVDTPTQSDGGHTTGFFDWLVDASDWDPIGLGVTDGNGETSWSLGKIGKDGYAKMGFYDDTTMYNEWGGLDIWQTIDNGNQTYAEIKDNAGNTIFVVTPREDGGYNYYNSYGDYVDSVINTNNTSYTLKDGFSEYITNKYALNFTPEDKAAFSSTWGLNSDDIEDMFVKIKREGSAYSVETGIETKSGATLVIDNQDKYNLVKDVIDKSLQPTDTFFVNGINNPNPPNVAPDYANKVVEKLGERGVQAQAIPLFEGTDMIGGAIEVGEEIYLPYSINKDKIKQVIIDRIESNPLQPGEKLKLILYSGGGQSGIEAADELGRERGIQFSDIVLIGSPVFFETSLPNVERLHYFVGGQDPLSLIIPALPDPTKPLYMRPFNPLALFKMDFTGFAGMGHTDYFKPDNIDTILDAVEDSFAR